MYIKWTVQEEHVTLFTGMFQSCFCKIMHSLYLTTLKDMSKPKSNSSHHKYVMKMREFSKH